MNLLRLILKNLRRNIVRTTLTSLAVIFLVGVFSMIATVLWFLDQATSEQTKDVNSIVSERFRIPSRFDRSYVDRIVTPGTRINRELTKINGFDSEKFNIWHFMFCSLDPEMKDQDQQFAVIATLPDKLAEVTEGLEDLDPRLPGLVREPPRSKLPNTGLVVGPTVMEKLGLKIGQTLKVKSPSHLRGTGLREPLEFEFEIVGTFPPSGMWSDSCFMDYEYLDRVLKEGKNEMEGQVMIGWLQTADNESAKEVGKTIQDHMDDLRVETLSSAMAQRMEMFGGLLWGIKFLLAPAILLVMTVILGNSISITVRERVGELAIMKVLGFRRGHILSLVLGEGILLGSLAGLFSGSFTYVLITVVMGGVPMGEGFPALVVPYHVIWWGTLVGMGTASLAAILPAWHASSAKVSEVFAKVT